MKNNAPAPSWSGWKPTTRRATSPLHMPGHKENTALAPYLAQLGAQWDITELPGFDDLHDPEGILAQAMDRAARLFGDRKSWSQVNGSTGACWPPSGRPPTGGTPSWWPGTATRPSTTPWSCAA